MTTTPGNPETFQPQGPGAYRTGTPTVPHQPPPGPSRQRNTVGLVALVVAVLGFIFAVAEGAYLLGWILLPIAFVLALVALLQRDRPKKMALAALIISIIGTIAGVVAFMGSAAQAFDEAFTDETTVSEPTAVDPGEALQSAEPQSKEETTDEPVAMEEEEAAAVGTRENPLPLGSSVSGEDWEVTVNSFSPDATDEVMAENQFNDEPDGGAVYALVNVTVKRIAPESGYPMEVSVGFVTASGNVVTSADAMAVAPESINDATELYEGAEASGNVALMIPQGDTGTLRVSPGLFADDAFFATS